MYMAEGKVKTVKLSRKLNANRTSPDASPCSSPTDDKQPRGGGMSNAFSSAAIAASEKAFPPTTSPAPPVDEAFELVQWPTPALLPSSGPRALATPC